MPKQHRATVIKDQKDREEQSKMAVTTNTAILQPDRNQRARAFLDAVWMPPAFRGYEGVGTRFFHRGDHESHSPVFFAFAKTLL